MAYETVFMAVIILLLAVICFLLYKLYRIKYAEGGGNEILSESWKKDLMTLESDKGRELEIRFEDINSRISEIEKKIEKDGKVFEKLVEELS